MPRVSEAEKQRSHKRIVDAAAGLFRQNGIEATSLSDVMKAAGMTHGGFYRHFSSKEDLVAAAFEHAVDGVVAEVEEATTEAERARALEAYLETYLSQEHVSGWEKGCPLAGLGVELARSQGATHEAGTAAAKRMAGLLQSSGSPDEKQGLAAMALLIGSVTLARLADTPQVTEKALEAGRTGLALLRTQWPDA